MCRKKISSNTFKSKYSYKFINFFHVIFVRCGCGRTKDEHENSAINDNNEEGVARAWDPAFDTIEDTLTDAYGEIVFNNNKEYPSKVIKVPLYGHLDLTKKVKLNIH
jgi:hypothetical protein